MLGELADARRLVAWVVGRDGVPPPAEQLRAHLRELLPVSAVPSAFVVLPSLPLAANGKVDHSALPAPEAVAAVEPAPRALPRDAREQRIAAAWSELLLRPAVGLDDNFFDLGGNSILVMRVHSQLQANEPALKVVDLFRYPTVRGLAAHLGSLGTANEDGEPGSESAADALEERARKRRQAQRRPTRP